jgi:CRISPR system Cascade subunit CasD
MSCVLLRLEGPLQSWGYRSRFSDRDTGLEPSKSGVIGLLCCALGRDRSESPGDLARLRMHVRVDRQGSILSDYQTAGAGVFRGSREYFAPTSSGTRSANAVLQRKHYLQDASFLVALEGDDERLLGEIESALQDPLWPMALGRRSCPPAEIVFAGRSVSPAREVLLADAPQGARLVWELPPGSPNGDVREDVPLIWSGTSDRQYGVRFVEVGFAPQSEGAR